MATDFSRSWFDKLTTNGLTLDCRFFIPKYAIIEKKNFSYSQSFGVNQ